MTNCVKPFERATTAQKLPSTRSIAQSLRISRTTATQSYDRLQSEGYFDTVVGSGTYVCHVRTIDAANFNLISFAINAVDSSTLLVWQPWLKTPLQPEPAEQISCRYGRPALTEFPTLAQIAVACWE